MSTTAHTPHEPRVPALDGLRGLMTILVVISHYFAELPNGYNALAFGHIAVLMFFVLSGYLVGKLILEKGDRANFYRVFYLRRICRTLPIYIACVLLTSALLFAFRDAPWLDTDHHFPLWSYLTFTQNFFMVSTDSIGAHWLAPTWTLTVEEHFYLLAPTLIIFTPRRYLLPLLLALIGTSLIVRWLTFSAHVFPEMAAFVLLPGLFDVVVFGILAALAMTTPNLPWSRIDPWLRILPLLLLITSLGLKLFDTSETVSNTFSHFLLSAACATFILALVRGVPEAKRFHNRTLRFFGDISYAVYLSHLPILGLAHGLLLQATPDAASHEQVLVSLCALPVCVLVSWLLTRYFEQPITRYGRSFKWSDKRVSRHH